MRWLGNGDSDKSIKEDTMNNYDSEVFAALVAIIIALIFYFAVEPLRCNAKYQNSEWGPLQGCMVYTSKGKVPAENLRIEQ